MTRSEKKSTRTRLRENPIDTIVTISYSTA